MKAQVEVHARWFARDEVEANGDCEWEGAKAKASGG